MKKLVTLAVLALLAAGVVLAATPFRETISVTAGSAAYTNNVSSYARQIEHVLFGGATGTVASLSICQGGNTNIVASITTAENATIATATNSMWLFKGDIIRVTTSDTNTHNVIIIGTQSPD